MRAQVDEKVLFDPIGVVAGPGVYKEVEVGGVVTLYAEKSLDWCAAVSTESPGGMEKYSVRDKLTVHKFGAQTAMSRRTRPNM